MLLSPQIPSADIPRIQDKPLPNILSGFRRRSSVPRNTILATNPSQHLPFESQSVAQSAAGDNMSPSPSYGIGIPISVTRLVHEEDAKNKKEHALA
jgi:hypothetical protein